MSDLPDLHPITGEPTRIVTGVIAPMIADTLKMTSRGAAYGRGRALVDLDNARDIASRRVGPAAMAEIGQTLLRLAAHGGDVAALAKGMNEIVHLCEGVASGKPSAIAVQVANRLLSEATLLMASGNTDAMDVIVLAYATLQLDEMRVLDGGVS